MNGEGVIHYLIDQSLDAIEQPSKAPELWAFLVRLEKKIEKIKSDIKDIAIEEVLKYSKEGITKNGYHMTVGNSASRWNYSLVEHHTALAKALKETEELAKTAYRTGGGIANSDGVLIQPAVPTGGGETIICRRVTE